MSRLAGRGEFLAGGSTGTGSGAAPSNARGPGAASSSARVSVPASISWRTYRRAALSKARPWPDEQKRCGFPPVHSGSKCPPHQEQRPIIPASRFGPGPSSFIASQSPTALSNRLILQPRTRAGPARCQIASFSASNVLLLGWRRPSCCLRASVFSGISAESAPPIGALARQVTVTPLAALRSL